MNFEHITIWYWILLLLVGIAFGVLGYILGKRVPSVPYDDVRFEALKNDNAQLQAELKTCQEKYVEKGKSPSVKNPISVPSFNAKQASALFGSKIKQDDLKVIEGIGPKIEQLFYTAGIKTWKALSDVQVKQCQEILDGGGSRFKIHDPASWPMQAKMCAEGKWKELAHWQEEHKHGKY